MYLQDFQSNKSYKKNRECRNRKVHRYIVYILDELKRDSVTATISGFEI